ncbi:hypothetical protein FKW77_005230 [Venturia effusa]|uniref:cellulase n=1 Tax=Venturia effusa TaxID=50376 RepID=A0A517L396_9PEZI|nr:hypothetical protein FKW77_005230 [Venturia effusa]
MFPQSFLFVLLAGLAAAQPVDQVLPRAANATRNFKFFGINQSGPEFGENTIPGLKNKEYVWPNLTTTDAYKSKGMNTMRINILAERLVVGKDQKGPLAMEYVNDLKATVKAYTEAGLYSAVCPHNYGRWFKEPIKDVDAFQTYWFNLASLFKDNDKVIFDTNNEFHDMDQALVVKLNQAAINGIRAAGAKTQYITVEGNSWTGAWTWTSSGNAATMGNLTDPSNKIIYQMHQYLDTDSSGSHEECVSTTIGVERLEDATKWLRKEKKIGLLGEYAGGNNAVCKEAVEAMLRFLVANNDVWVGHIWWASGPWWATYMYSMEPHQGVAWNAYADLISKYA